ncbi:unnamed protein product [Chilo suppressalis]|uniref:THAP-type domain-containing protein n=1 Tax=Chilo suppressalis TaxID=168631 RepID=A0ABN8LBH2_CHISP|nr:unnamed protein product [Chilo suppressalis]
MSLTQNYKTKEHATEYSENKTRSTPVAMVAPELKHSADVDTEISKTCAVLGCEDSKNLDPQSFFRFPEDGNLKQIWTDLTGRNNWTPTDYSYICIQHFSVDCFECDSSNTMVLVDSAVPSLKLPKHVLEVEYIDEDSLDNEYHDQEYMETDEYEEEEEETVDEAAQLKTNIQNITPNETNNTINQTNSTIETNGDNEKTEKAKPKEVDKANLLKLFTEVQQMQKQAVSLKDKLKNNMKLHNRQNRYLHRIERLIERKRKILEQKQKKKSKILLSLQDKISEDMNGLVLAMPVRQTEDLKNFALNIYNYSPQAYIYLRNTLRTMLPSTEVLESWLSSGFQPKTVLSSSNVIKVTAEQTEKELSCKISIG